MLCEHTGPRDHQASDCCVNPKDQEITRRVSLCEHKGPGDHQASDYCVNPMDQEITRRVSVV